MSPFELALSRADALESTGNLLASAGVLGVALEGCTQPDLRRALLERIDAAQDASADHTRNSLPHAWVPGPSNGHHS